MEEDIRKQGMVYFQQQRFGKKWKRVWCVLYRESSCSISRLEFFECKEGGTLERNDKMLRKQQEHKKVIRLSDCIRVSEVEMDGCPRDTGPFLVETTEKIYVFAADRQQLDDWTHKLCETAFPISWAEHGGKRGSLQRGGRVEEEEEGMEDNSLYSGRQTVRDFRVCVRKTEASDRCRLKGVCVLRTDVDGLLLLEPKTRDVLFTWPYRFLRRFGRDKATFSFEAGRRCDSGEGGFEFDTKQGNVLFQAVEAAINLQRIAFPRQTSGGGQEGPETPPLPQARTPPLLQPRCQLPPPPAQPDEGVYSMVKEAPGLQLHPKETSSPPQQQRPLQMSRLEAPVDKVLTCVKSLTLDTRGVPVPRKNQVKNISSCPLPHSSDLNPSPTLNPRLSPNLSPAPDPASAPGQTYSQVIMPQATEKGGKREKREKRGGMASLCPPPLLPQEPEYSLPFDTIAKNVMADILNSHQALGLQGAESGADPLYDSIDEMQIRLAFQGTVKPPRPTYSKAEHIYDEPEGCAAIGQTPTTPASLYDEPEEVKGNAWRIMGTAVDPKGHEYPYNPRVDDYAVPKRPQRAFPAEQNTNEEEDEEETTEEEEEEEDSPYDNVMVKKTEREKK